jgi:hypothetical protein
MAITTNLKFGNATDESVEKATLKNNGLPRQELQRLVRVIKEISDE